MTLTPYPFQETAIQAGVGFFTNPKVSKPKLMVLPTGTGKSLIIANIAARLDDKVLVFQPSAEILMQNYRKYVAIDHNAEIFSASLKRRRFAKVTFCTIGSIKSIPELFSNYKYLIIDECHLYPSKAESMFGQFIKHNSQLKILGLTATPFRLNSGFNYARLDMLHRGHIYNEYVHITQIKDIADKYWSPLEYIIATGNKAVLKANESGIEYTDESLELYFHTIEDKVVFYADQYKDESKFIFVPSIATAESLVPLIPNSAVISAYTKRKERDKIFSDFIAGKLKAILNVNVLGVGIDMPFLRVIIDAKPTMSLANLYQKIGRLTRKHPYKSHGTIIDLSGSTDKFGRIEDLELRKLATTYHFFSGNKQITGVNLTDYSFPPKPESEVEFIDVILTFGKYRGSRLSSIDDQIYYDWIIDHVTWDDALVRNTKIFVARNKKMIEQELL